MKSAYLLTFSGVVEVTLNDVSIALKGALGLLMLTPDQRGAYDADGDGRLDVRDVVRLLRRALGLPAAS